MNVLHYSFSLSACPKCHLLVCKHTSLAELDFQADQQHRTDGMNVYLFPSTVMDTRYSWTTFGTELNESIDALDNPTLGENIPFANECIIDPMPIQLEKGNHSSSDLPISTITNKFFSYPSDRVLRKSSSFVFVLLLLLIFFFLITNTIDIVLIYIYYHLHYISLISYLSTIILCDTILWLNQSKTTIPSYFLLIPISFRFYLLYHLLELLLIILDRSEDQHGFHSLYRMKKLKLYQNLMLFYLIHTGCFAFFNLYFWSNHFQFSTEGLLNMDYFIPQWINHDQLLPMDTHHSWQIFDPIPSSSVFVFTSILYNLIVNYSFLSTYLRLQRLSFLLIISRLCLIISRLYAFLFLVHFNAWWCSMIVILGHVILITTLLFNQRKHQTIFFQLIFSFFTHQSIDDLTVNAVISLENMLIFFYRLYLDYSAWRLIGFISILISLQMMGLMMDILSKYIHYRTKTMITKL